MRLKIMIVDWELSRRQKLVGALGICCATALFAGTASGIDKTFVAGEQLKAADLNGAFADLQTQIDLLSGGTAEPTFEGFSVWIQGYAKPASWVQIPWNMTDFNTFDAASFDTGTGVFTAPKAGYYRFSAGGFASTATTASDSRVGYAISVNGTSAAVSGGQLSAVDTPLPTFSYVVALEAADDVSFHMFTPIPVVLGAASEYQAWFQGEYLGQ